MWFQINVTENKDFKEGFVKKVVKSGAVQCVDHYNQGLRIDDEMKYCCIGWLSKFFIINFFFVITFFPPAFETISIYHIELITFHSYLWILAGNTIKIKGFSVFLFKILLEITPDS